MKDYADFPALRHPESEDVFAGDGKPDILPAREADVVFAKKKLLELCCQEDIPTENFASFADIYRYLKEN